MALEKTLVLLKPCTVQRALMGEVLSRFEKKGLRVCGLKMMQLDDALLSEHYAHLAGKEFFQRVKDSMMVCPVVAIALSALQNRLIPFPLSNARSAPCAKALGPSRAPRRPGSHIAAEIIQCRGAVPQKNRPQLFLAKPLRADGVIENNILHNSR